MGAPEYRLDIALVADDENRATLETGLNQYNRATSPYFAQLATPEGKQQPVDVYVRDAQGRIVGGIAATTYWGWLSIGLLWLDERIRGRGYGTRALNMVEAEAQRRGCTHSRVSTYSFQARGFYEKTGYRVVGQLDNFPPGGAMYTLCKDLTLHTA